MCPGSRTVLPIANSTPRLVQLNWSPVSACYRLQAAPAVTGPWTDLPGVPNGGTVTVTPGARFFRLAEGIATP